MNGPHVLVARLDSLGDVLLAGPAVRAVAAGAGRVTFLCGPAGQAAAELLPGVDEVVSFLAPWIDPEPEPVDPEAIGALVNRLRGLAVDQAIVLTSFHQNALPLALLLRMAGVATVAAISEDYPGSLLDVRHHVPPCIHEVERALSLVATLGYRLPPGDGGELRVLRPAAGFSVLDGEPYVVVHPGASVSARAWSPDLHRQLVTALAHSRNVVVTGGPGEAGLCEFVAGVPARDGRAATPAERGVPAGSGGPGCVPNAVAALKDPGARRTNTGGRLSFPELAEVLAGADVVVVGNTGPAHLAAAVGTPVVSLFAPTVNPACWRPWAVPHVLLGDLDIACAGCRARECPVAGHPCVDRLPTDDVVAAVDALTHRPIDRPKVLV